MRRSLLLAFALVAGAAAAQDAPAFGTPEPWHIAGPFGRVLGARADPALLRMALTGNCEGTTPAGLTFTRASTATCTLANGVLKTLAANAPRLKSQGLQMEGAATNVELQSAALDNAPWATLNASVLPNQCAAPDGTQTGDVVTTSTTGGHVSQTYGITGSQFVRSAWLSKQSGTGPASVAAFCGSGTTGVTACTCATGDGTSCTAAISGSTCYAYATVGTTPVRLEARATCTGTATAMQGFVTGGQFNASTGSACVWGTQFETGPIATSHIPTQGTQVTRSGDDPAIPKPTGFSETQGCTRLTVVPDFTGVPIRTMFGLMGNVAATSRFAQFTDASNAGAVGGGSFAQVAHGFLQGVPRTFTTQWSTSAATLTITRQDNSTSATGTGFAGYAAFDAALDLGVNGASGQWQGHIRDVVLGAKTGDCQ